MPAPIHIGCSCSVLFSFKHVLPPYRLALIAAATVSQPVYIGSVYGNIHCFLDCFSRPARVTLHHGILFPRLQAGLVRPGRHLMQYSIDPSRSATFQQRRQAKLDELSPTFDVPLTDTESKIASLPLSELVDRHQAGSVSTQDIIYTYGKKAFAAQKATNCLSDIMIHDLLPPTGHVALTSNSDPYHPTNGNGYANGHADFSPSPSVSSVETFADDSEHPLSGVPVSIKDVVDVEGYPSTMGYSANALTPVSSSAPIILLLRRAGALLHVKTTVPMGLFSLETESELFGRTSNPINPAYSSGASTGGGASLLAMGGSVIELGTDVGGSVRLPAAFCGIYGMKASNGRFPSTGIAVSTPGCEAVPTVVSPLARRLEDLEEFWKRVMELRPWEIDRTVSDSFDGSFNLWCMISAKLMVL